VRSTTLFVASFGFSGLGVYGVDTATFDKSALLDPTKAGSTDWNASTMDVSLLLPDTGAGGVKPSGWRSDDVALVVTVRRCSADGLVDESTSAFVSTLVILVVVGSSSPEDEVGTSGKFDLVSESSHCDIEDDELANCRVADSERETVRPRCSPGSWSPGKVIS
jgi:hypothetical protein